MILGLLALPAGADDPAAWTDEESGELTFDEQQAYIHQAETKAGNVGATGAPAFPSWDGAFPEDSVTQGAGGGYLANSADDVLAEDKTLAGLTLEGEVTGCLDTMLVELYAFLPTNRTGTAGDLEPRPFAGYVSLDIAGQPAVHYTELEMHTDDNPHGDATYRIRMAITGLHASIVKKGLDPEGTHELRLNILPRWINTSHALFVYDTVEVPAGILFNGTPDSEHPSVRAF